VTRSRRGRLAPLGILLVLTAGWFFFAPPQLGGSTLYSATVGTSMEPLFHAGDLAVVRRAHSYRVGQTVLYESPVFHRAVLHRILVIQHGRYYFKGDNNDFVDAGYATRGDLLGTLWFRVPKAGRILSWAGKPGHSALVAAVGTLLVLLVGRELAPLGLRRRRRRGTARPGRGGTPMLTKSAAARLRRPRRSLLSLLGLVLLVTGIVALTTGLTRPTTRTVRVRSYESTGSFSYVGRASVGSSAAYPTGNAQTGAPIFLSEIRSLNVSFAYRFLSTLPHHVRGTIVLRGVLVDQGSTWRHAYRLGAPKSFSGDRAAVSARMNLRDLTKQLDGLAASAGTPGASYEVRLAPLVRIVGTVAGKRVTQTFAPKLPFTATEAVLKLEISPPATAPGATYATPSAASLLLAALHPSQDGTLPKSVPNTLTLGGARFTDAALEIAGAMLALAGAWALVAGQFRRRRQVWSTERRIAHRYGRDLFDVSSLAEVPPNTAITPVPDLESLAGIARQAERPILRHATGDVAVFVVDDPPRLYRFEQSIVPEPAAAPAPPARSTAPRRLPAIPRRATGVAGLMILLALVVGISSATFTSGNVVPVSRASRSSFPRTLVQLVPALCSGVNPANLVVATGSATAGSPQDDLILGRNAPGAQTLNGNAGTDCIVAGGGPGTTNTLQGGGGKGDVCIGAPGAVNVYSGCETTGVAG